MTVGACEILAKKHEESTGDDYDQDDRRYAPSPHDGVVCEVVMGSGGGMLSTPGPAPQVGN